MVNILSEQRDSLLETHSRTAIGTFRDKQAALPPGRPQFPHFTPRRHPDSGLLRTLGLSCSPTLKRLGR